MVPGNEQEPGLVRALFFLLFFGLLIGRHPARITGNELAYAIPVD